MKNDKKAFQFALILSNVDEYTSGLEDRVYGAGCDDALINFRNGTVYLDFDRKASSLKEAVISAILQIESLPFGLIVAGVSPDNFVMDLEGINAALEERNTKTRENRQELVGRLSRHLLG